MNNHTIETIAVGESESFTVSVDESDMKYFAQLTGDHNPLHVDASYAKKNGFDDKVVFGMLTASHLSRMAGMYLPGERSILQEVNIRFSSPVFPGDKLVFSGVVTEKDERFRQIHVKVTVHNQHEKKVAQAKMKVGVREQ